MADVLTTDTLKELKLARREAGAAKETINNDLGAVSVLVTFAVERGWITKRPSVKRFKRTQRIRYLAGSARTLHGAPATELSNDDAAIDRHGDEVGGGRGPPGVRPAREG